MVETKFVLNGLSCANCAAKIENKISKLPHVFEASVSFISKELKIKLEDDTNLLELKEIINKIVKETESGVDVCEINPQINSVSISGLSCASCSAKIEKKLKQTVGIKDVYIDFIGKKLNYSLSIDQNKIEMLNKIKRIISEVEPGVEIKEINENNNSQTEEFDKWKLYRLFFGTITFMSVLFINKESILYLSMFIISYLLIGVEVVFRALRNIFKGKIFDENFLMTIATTVAFVVGEYPEAVAVMLFYQVGEVFQDRAVNRSRRSIKKLMSIRPDVANLQKGQEIISVKVEEVNVDDVIIIKPGERVPLDGIILEGNSSLDTKALTGESLPLNVSVTEQVLSGCININGLLTVKVTKTARESTVAKILELVENATSKKAPTENFITKFARGYTPIVTISALLLAVIPPLFINGAEFSDWVYRALIFLVISCPCALVVSIPLGFFGGIGAASKNGILVKGGNYLEALNNIEIAVFDKTGTLTEGSFVVTKLSPLNISNTELLEKAAYVESFSNHPIAMSVLKEYKKEVDQSIVTNVFEIPGKGIKAIVGNDEVIVGNDKLLIDEEIDFVKEKCIGSIIYVAINKNYVGNIVVSDEIKKDSKKAIKLLKSLGIKKTIMLTGDKLSVANSVGAELGIDDVYAELLPVDKLNIVEDLIKNKSKQGKLFFVGDGINDTPVLARADIGIAMGALGADSAIDVADVVIMTDEPSKIVSAIKVAKKTRRIVWQNILFALSVKSFFLILGAFGIASMWEAVFADVGVSLLAIFNAMRVLRYKEI